MKVSIPQAVGTIAMKGLMQILWTSMKVGFNTASGRYYCNIQYSLLGLVWSKTPVSIPQAVGTIAIARENQYFKYWLCFNTASGRYYCNLKADGSKEYRTTYWVSIPQAVGTIAICHEINNLYLKSRPGFNTASGRYYCNRLRRWISRRVIHSTSFNTASGRYYCNLSKKNGLSLKLTPGFNTASGRYYCNQSNFFESLRA